MRKQDAQRAADHDLGRHRSLVLEGRGLWLARVLTTADRPRDEAVRLAVRIVDDNFGFNKLLGTARQAWAVQTLADRGDLARLVAWYAR